MSEITQIQAILSAIALVCSTALVIRLSTASVKRGRMWIFLTIIFMLMAVAKWTHVIAN